MFLWAGTGDEEVIYVGVAEVHATENLVYEMLEGLSCIF